MDVQTVCRQVYQKFPDFQGVQPKILQQPNGSSLLLFETEGRTPDGKLIKRTIRVVVGNNGKIAKMSTSR